MTNSKCSIKISAFGNFWYLKSEDPVLPTHRRLPRGAAVFLNLAYGTTATSAGNAAHELLTTLGPSMILLTRPIIRM